MCVRKISGSVEMWGRTCSSLLQSQIFYVYRPRPHVFRGSAEEAPGKRFGTGGGLFSGLSSRARERYVWVDPFVGCCCLLLPLLLPWFAACKASAVAVIALLSVRH